MAAAKNVATVRKPKRIKKLVIQRSKWARGNSSGLLETVGDDRGKMCCLGFLARKCGLTAAEIRERGFPRSLPKKLHPLWPEWARPSDTFDDTVAVLDAVDINDNPDLTDAKREKQLTELFAEQGVELVFVP